MYEASSGKQKGNYNTNPFDENFVYENKNNPRVLSAKARVVFFDPLEDQAVKAAWDEYVDSRQLSPKEKRIRLSFIADALREQRLSPDEIVQALETSSDENEMYIVLVCKGEV